MPDEKELHIEVLSKAYVQVLAGMTPSQRLHQAFRMHASTSKIIRARVAELYPNASPEELHFEFVKRVLGHDGSALFARLYRKCIRGDRS